MKIAICQLNICYENRKQNLERAEVFAQQAAKEDADMILFPEMSFTGFSMRTELTGELQNELFTLPLMQEWAKKFHIAIGFGWIKGTKQAQNHYTVVDENGVILEDYVKIHPFSYSMEDQYFQAGDKVCTFSYKGFCFGLSICYDLRFPELYQELSKQADVILVPANWPERRSLHWKALLQARAIENQAYFIGINCCGEQDGLVYSGDSAVIAPTGEILHMQSDVAAGELFCVNIENDVFKIREEFPVKRDRKVELYKSFYEK